MDFYRAMCYNKEVEGLKRAGNGISDAPFPARSASQSGAVPKRYRRKKLAFSRTPSRALAKLWRQRTNRVFQNCLCVSIPLVTVFLFIFQCLLLILSFTSTPAEYEIRITSAFAGIGDEVINDIEAMEDVAYVVAKKSPSPGEFYIEGPEGEQVPVRIHSFSDLDAINENLEKYDAAVEIDSAAMELKPGDQIRLIRFEGQTGEELFALTAKQVLASEEGETASDVYIDDVLLTVILNLLPCNELEINRRRHTILLVTHEQRYADLCARNIVISDGKIIQDSLNG